MARLSENLIAISIVPQYVARWIERGTTPAWTSAHDCVDAFKGLVREVDLACLQIEENKEFSSDAIRRRRVEICDKAIAKLDNFKAFYVAERAIVDEINLLERRSYRDAQKRRRMRH